MGVNAVVTQGTNLFVSGSFTAAGGIPANHIARWDGWTWSPLGSGLDQRALALSIHPDGSLYAGGEFSRAGEAGARGIARWDGTAWAAFGGGVEPGSRVWAIASGPGGEVYAGGTFTQIGGVTAANVARWDGTRWWDMDGGGGGPLPLLPRPCPALNQAGQAEYPRPSMRLWPETTRHPWQLEIRVRTPSS